MTLGNRDDKKIVEFFQIHLLLKLMNNYDQGRETVKAFTMGTERNFPFRFSSLIMMTNTINGCSLKFCKEFVSI